MRTKSKNDLTRQITRIYTRFSEHRLYNIALSIVMRYNMNMSDTDRNKHLHSLYMMCHHPFSGTTIPHHKYTEQRLLSAMGNSQYPASIYAKNV